MEPIIPFILMTPFVGKKKGKWEPLKFYEG